MKRMRFAVPVVLCLLGLVVSCSPAEVGDSGQAVQKFYEHLNGGDGDAALALYTAEVRQMLGGEDGKADETFADWVQAETRQGTIQEVKILKEDVDDGAGSATVGFELHYSTGNPERRTVTLAREEGSWRLGYIDKQ